MMLVLAIAAAATVAVGTFAIDTKLLDGLPVATATLSVHGKTIACSGPLFAEVIARIGAPTGKDIGGSALNTSIIAAGRDGYRVRFSLGEIDPMLGASKAIVATTCDGKPIGETDGPYRLVVPGEQRAARSVRQLESLTIQP
jgi:hypothetical protein